MELTVPTILGAYLTAHSDHSLRPPATEVEILAAEERICARLPAPLRDLYAFSNGGSTYDMQFIPLEKDPEEGHYFGLTSGTEILIELGYRIPRELLLFASDIGGDYYGIWLPETKSPPFENPIIMLLHELINEEDCMGIVGTNLTSFLLTTCVYGLEKIQDRSPEQLEREEDARKILKVPRYLWPDGTRERHRDCSIKKRLLYLYDSYYDEVQEWADPHLPSECGDPFYVQFSTEELRRMFS